MRMMVRVLLRSSTSQLTAQYANSSPPPSSIPMVVLMASPEPLHGPCPSTLIGSLAPGKNLNDLVIQEPVEVHDEPFHSHGTTRAVRENQLDIRDSVKTRLLVFCNSCIADR